MAEESALEDACIDHMDLWRLDINNFTDLLGKKDVIGKTLLEVPYMESLFKNHFCGTLSKAFNISKAIIFVMNLVPHRSMRNDSYDIIIEPRRSKFLLCRSWGCYCWLDENILVDRWLK